MARISVKTTQNLKLTHDSNIFFSRCSRRSGGDGLGLAGHGTLFHALQTSMKALLVGRPPTGRRVPVRCTEQHLLGHEIKVGNHAGSPAHFMKKPRAEAVKKRFQSRKSHSDGDEISTIKILRERARPEPAQFDTKRYAQVASKQMRCGLAFARSQRADQSQPETMPGIATRIASGCGHI